MFISVFDIFKIGVGPSSSHTMGPMVAARRFLHELRDGDWPRPAGMEPERLRVTLHGSLAFTGKGHATDRAVALGLSGVEPRTLDAKDAEQRLERLRETGRLAAEGFPDWAFDPDGDIVFDYGPPLEGHANAMTCEALAPGDVLLLRRVYYSVGGGFVVDEDELGRPPAGSEANVPYPFATGREMLDQARRSGLGIADMKRENERAAGQDVSGVSAVAAVMRSCVERGLATDGVLPGGLQVKRRARAIHERLEERWRRNELDPMAANDWLAVFAMAVNEENAAGGQVVTAPTNGAAGVIPAVLAYHHRFTPGASPTDDETFLLTAAAIGGIVKSNASISGAEVGCQGEVGSASAMAAAGLAAVLGGTPEQIENAAEIALEHHLGMTCDPVAGLVQVPCIERNAFGAVKAVTAASLALHGDGTHLVSLDACIETMRQTGRDMDEKYKETSQGGLAVNVVAC